MSIDILCPYCRQEFDIREGRNDLDWFELVETLHSLPAEVHKPLWQYLELFRGKQRLRSATLLKIVRHLAPMIKNATVMRGSVAYAVSPREFARAMSYLAEQTPTTLSLPLKSNGYLLQMLISHNQKAAALAEQQQEQQKQVHAQQRSGKTSSIQKIMEKSPQQILAELQQKQARLQQRKQEQSNLNQQEQTL